MKILRVDTLENDIIEEFELRKDEKFIIKDEELYIMSTEEYNKLMTNKIEYFELQNAPYHLDAYQEFIVKEV